jgi:hypothetical protein
MKPVPENESRYLGQNEMAGLKGKSGPPGNMNAFKHGLAAIQKRREEGVPTQIERFDSDLIVNLGSDLPSAIHFAGRAQGRNMTPNPPPPPS